MVVALSGVLLTVVGFDEKLPQQEPHTVFWMRVLFAVAPACFVVLSILCTKSYPLREARMREIRAELDARKSV
jgi:GPH family glycoside/pentoside/hexuronide:cation symporter